MRKLLIGVVALVGVLLAVVAAAPLLIPTEAIKARLTDQVRAATGRELRIAGPIRLTLVPGVGVQAENVSFANMPGGKAAEMAQLKSLSVEFRLRPLLQGRIEVARLLLTDPLIALEVDRDGRGNWVFDPPRAAPPPAGEAPVATRTASGQSDMRLDDIRLVGGRVSWRDRRSGVSHVLEKIDLKLSLPGLGAPFTAEGSAVWNGEKIILAATAASPAALLAGKDSALALQIDAAPVRLRLDGTLTGLPPARTTGTVDLAMPSLRKFAAWAGTPIALPGDGLGPLAIKGRLSRAGDEIAFSDADIALDGMRAKGALTVVTAGPRPLLKGHLDIDRLDLNPYLPPPASRPAVGAAGAAPAAEHAGWSDAPLDFSGLQAVDADLDLAAGAVLYRQLRIDQARLGVHLREGRLTAELREVALYRGAGNGRLAVDASGTVPALDLSFALAHVQIEPLLLAAAGMDRLSGNGTFNLAVACKGGSQRELISSLGGKGALNLADGVVKGVNLLALAQSIAPGAAKGDGGDSTVFGSLNGTFTIAGGVLRNDDLLLKTRLAPVSGSGTVNLAARSIDYRVVAQIGGTVKVPIQIGGTFEHPTYRPELAGTIEQFRALVPGAGGGAAKPASPADLLRGLLPR